MRTHGAVVPMDETLWAVGRVSGFAALGLFTLTVVLGILTRSGRPLFAVPRFTVTLLHRNMSLLATAFLLLHIGTLLLDSYARLRLADAFIPFLGAFKPFWQGLGTAAFDLVLAVVATGLLRHRIGRRTFRAVHWFSYAMWPLAMGHAIGNGTNGKDGWFLAVAAASMALVAAALLWRVSASFLDTARARQGILP